MIRTKKPRKEKIYVGIEDTMVRQEHTVSQYSLIKERVLEIKTERQVGYVPKNHPSKSGQITLFHLRDIVFLRIWVPFFLGSRVPDHN